MKQVVGISGNSSVGYPELEGDAFFYTPNYDGWVEAYFLIRGGGVFSPCGGGIKLSKVSELKKSIIIDN